MVEGQEHIKLQVGTEIECYEQYSDTGVTLSPSLQQALALKANGKLNLSKLQRLCANEYLWGSRIFLMPVSILWNVVRHLSPLVKKFMSVYKM